VLRLLWYLNIADKVVEHIQVICPGFSADCLETLEEINKENRGYFIQAGGKTIVKLVKNGVLMMIHIYAKVSNQMIVLF
jgi:protoheme ferro-lyase